MPEKSRRGYLVLADISGYTSFLATVELEHAHEILADLLEIIVDKFRTLLTISKLEGDAVFAYVDESRIARGEVLMELIENTYVAFRQRRDTSKRASTCSCRACQSMPSLELKFFVHCGSFMVQNVAGIREIVGTDVNLVHRLMKNHLTENTGWNAYSLFTQNAIEALKVEIDEVHRQAETYEHLGTIETVTINLIPRYDAYTMERRYYITDRDAHLNVSRKFDISEAELWQIQTSTEILSQLNSNNVWSVEKLIGGRTAPGAQNHCLHGKGIFRLTIVDWHPFDYFTGYGVDGKTKFYQMQEIEKLPDNKGVILHIKWKYDNNLPNWFNKLIGTFMGVGMGPMVFNPIENYINKIEHPAFIPETE